ncbi:hypothetical protein ABZ079_23340 [Streptomyces sp. NPDC006314]|uniref:hypothetical protein n=1 Tax=Streptomyces sp. NPDC006314 TaxID=3154475 RepID=UPI0033ADCC8E
MEGTADQDVFGGVDSHADTIHVAVISDNGGHLAADAEFATTSAGYAACPTTTVTSPDIADLRPLRRAENITSP